MDTILYVGGFRLPDGNAAGPRVLNNAKILRDMGYNVVFIDVADEVSGDISDTLKKIDGFDCYSQKYPRGIEWFEYLTLISDVKKVFGRYANIKGIIVYNYQAGAFFKLKAFCKKKHVKLYADCTEWYRKRKNPIKNIDSDLRMKKIQKEIDGVIAISRYLYEYYKPYTNTVLIPPLNDCDEEKWCRDNGENECLTFSYAGSPGRHKDKLNMIIEALECINTEKEYKFNVIGITKEQYLEYYPEHSEILEKMSDRVLFKGRVTRAEVLSDLKKSDFSVFFRPDTLVSKAGFPTKYAEAVTCGVPVIANLTSNIGDYLKDGINGFVIDGFSAAAIKDAFERVFAFSDEELGKMKFYCRKNNRVFHYKKFETEMRNLIGKQ